MKKRVKKSKDHKIQDAVTALNKAMGMEDPNIQITAPGFGYGFCDEEGAREFGKAVKTFVEAYKKYYGVTKVSIHVGL